MDTRMVVTYIIVDIFCIILAVSMTLHINRDCGSEFEVRGLRRALISYCGFLVAGLLGVLMEAGMIGYLKAGIWLSNMLSLFLLAAVSYDWCMFATARLLNQFPSKWVIYGLGAPVALVGLLCATTPWTGYVFTLSGEGTYQRGPLFPLVYVPMFLYSFIVLVLAIVAGAKERQHEKRRQCLVIALFFAFPTVAGFLQVYMSGMPILAPAIVTGFFLVFINIQSSQIYNDALTGLNNRRRVYYYIGEQLAAVAENKPLTVYMMDINSFKQINDQYGHAEGDHTLHVVAQALTKLGQRHHLFVARYGGDEFVLVASWRHPEQPQTIVAAFREILAEQCQQEALAYELSVSVGYAMTQDPKETMDHLVNRADQSLYHEKRQYHALKKSA